MEEADYEFQQSLVDPNYSQKARDLGFDQHPIDVLVDKVPFLASLIGQLPSVYHSTVDSQDSLVDKLGKLWKDHIHSWATWW